MKSTIAILGTSIILFLSSTNGFSQHAYGINHYFTTASGAVTTGEYLFSLNHANGGGDYGIGVKISNDTKLFIWNDLFEFRENVLLGDNLTLRGTMSSFSMESDGSISDLDILAGTNDLRFKGSAGDDVHMKITDIGLIGMGTNSPISKLHVVGSDSDGASQATLTIQNGSSRMFLDGNEIDAAAGSLYLQNNSAHDLLLINGGGNLGLNKSTPVEKLHMVGNFRIDNGDIMSHGPLEFRPDVDETGDDVVVFYNNASESTLRIHDDGNIGIGVDAPTEKLEVDGTVKASTFVTSTASFPDYVFDNDYQVMPLGQLQAYIHQYKHLPNMPAEKEVVENGLNVNDVLIKSVENIETIYLHLIELSQKLDELKLENAELKAQLTK